MNYQIDDRNFTSLQGILEDYLKNCLEKENFQLQVIELGRILREVFPEANRVQRRVNGCRTWQYPLSKKSNLEIDTVKWEDLPTFTKEFGWLLSSSRDNLG